MLVGVSIIAIIVAAVMWLKDALDKPVAAENWANEELLWLDMQNGVSVDQQIRYLKQGRYKMPSTPNFAPVAQFSHSNFASFIFIIRKGGETHGKKKFIVDKPAGLSGASQPNADGIFNGTGYSEIHFKNSTERRQHDFGYSDSYCARIRRKSGSVSA